MDFRRVEERIVFPKHCRQFIVSLGPWDELVAALTR